MPAALRWWNTMSTDTTFDLMSFIIAYEEGELEHDEIVEGFQHLIDNGMAWTLQGSYGRLAAHFIEIGECHE